jgi:aldehyde dehydrogenase (NAD+)
MHLIDQFYIDGQWRSAAVGARTMPIVNPATEQTIGELTLGTRADTDAAVRAARAAFPAWSTTSRETRIALLEKIAALYEARFDDLCRAVSEEMGAPVWLCREYQVPLGLVQIRTVLEALREFPFSVTQGTTLVSRHPIGVAALITPWNWPINQIAAKVAPALAAGCTVVLKPSEQAALDAKIFAEILHEAGVPAGVFNMVYGDGPTVGSALSAHPDVDLVSITGSTRAGVQVAIDAAPTVKRVTQELGGKSANLILDDADLAQAIPASVVSCMLNSGQTCTAPTRLLVPRAQLATVLDIARQTVSALTVGDPLREESRIGPLANAAQYAKVIDMIRRGVAEGARIVTGGDERIAGAERGFYIQPTIFADVTNQMDIAQEEIFGPVLVVIAYDTEEEAVAIANDSPYGLAAYVWSADLDRARRIAARMEAGTVHLNGAMPDFAAPFGGVKQSGNGREYGAYGLAEFLEYKSVMGYATEASGFALDIDVFASRPFASLPDCIREQAQARGTHAAVTCGDDTLDYAQFDAAIDRFAATLQREAIGTDDVVALCAASSINYLVSYLGSLRAGACVAPLAPGLAPEALAAMVANSGASLLLTDASYPSTGSCTDIPARRVSLDNGFDDWLAPLGSRPTHIELRPSTRCNLIYSSGTTGLPKGIVQPHSMRWSHVQQSYRSGYGPDAVTLAATPLYSNTTLVSVLPTLALGGSVILMPKFDAATYLTLAQQHRATHTMLVPVQYQRLLAHPDFHRTDLSAFKVKFCTSAPFDASLKFEVIRHWPGRLIEFYGMTEGGGACALDAGHWPDKLHTVGKPLPGHDIRLIDENGQEVRGDVVGEVVGRSDQMMTAYHGLPEKTAEIEWFNAQGLRYIRTGDLGRFDADGFLVLLGRRKDLIISGGFNVYPTDLEAVLREHEDVSDAAVIGVPSEQWGETPVAFVVAREHIEPDETALLQWANARLGKVQRIAQLRLIDVLPRNGIGKVLKPELQQLYLATTQGKKTA